MSVKTSKTIHNVKTPFNEIRISIQSRDSFQEVLHK